MAPELQDDMPVQAGLCETCAFARVIESAKSSRFWLCRLSETDARFPKYPPLPVLACEGYERGAGANLSHSM